MKVFGPLATIAVLLAAAVQVQALRERAYPPVAGETDTLTLSSGSVVRRLSVAYTGLTADLYWIRAIQYYGGTKRRLVSEFPALTPPQALTSDPDAEYPLLYPLLELTTTLDPRFNVAYRFGAIFLAEPYPSGPGRPDLAVALLQKGLRERPDKWEYMQDIGFVHYWYGRDYATAATWFDRAARIPNAPWWLKSLAATTLTLGGDRRSSRQMWAAIRESAEVDWLRRDAERRLLQLQALDAIDELQKRLDAYGARTGQPAPDWPTLIRAGVVPGIPADPSGTPYELVSGGRVRLAESSALWPPPDEPQTVPPRPPA